MRITNNMMLSNTANRINTNKVSVDALNQQMSSQKKIQRPSEDPIIAIRALRLRTSLSEINQYYERNIPDANSWLEITETALSNMVELITDVRTQCDYGDNDYLTADDRNTILTNLEKLQEQIYKELNTDYAGRTVFTGYRTNKDVTFTEDEKDTTYEITQTLSYQSIEEHRYYADGITVPTTAEAVAEAVPTPKMEMFDRIRLAYGEIFGSADGGDEDDDIKITVPAGYSYDVKDEDGKVTEKTGIDVMTYDTYEDWLTACKNAATADDSTTDTDDVSYSIADGEAVFIRETGELILSEGVSSTLRSMKAEITVEYTKTGFNDGELRPEYYYNCTDVTDSENPIKYVKYDENGDEIYQDINYNVATNQQMTVNTSASDVLDSSLGRDIEELIDAVNFAIEANDKVDQIEKMMEMEAYSSDEDQEKLGEWLEMAEKECSYAEQNMQKLYNAYIGKCDEYLNSVDLALTTVGSKMSSLELIENRMSNQQTTVETLKSENEDRDITDIIIDYTAAYNAYQASLQAASKLNQNTLLNYM